MAISQWADSSESVVYGQLTEYHKKQLTLSGHFRGQFGGWFVRTGSTFCFYLFTLNTLCPKDVNLSQIDCVMLKHPLRPSPEFVQLREKKESQNGSHALVQGLHNLMWTGGQLSIGCHWRPFKYVWFWLKEEGAPTSLLVWQWLGTAGTFLHHTA